ncbi:MAG: transcription antitermination factor NusB [Alphaproteobacteria bacterium]
MTTGTPSAAEPAAPGRRRSAARLGAVQALYQAEVTGAGVETVLKDFRPRRLAGEALTDDPETEREVAVPLVEPDFDLLAAIVRGATARREDLDGMIAGALSADWTPERLELIIRSILRAGTFELLERGDVPLRVVITEYVDVAHAFYGGPEPGLVNAVLDRIGRLVRPDERGAKGGR